MRQLKPLFLLIALWGLFGTDSIAYDFQATNDDGVTLFYLWRKDKTELTVTFEGKTWVATESYKGVIRIPESVTYEGKTYPVTRIGDNAFYNCKEMTSIVIPSSINSIGDGALGECIGLESLFIPKTVTTIGENAFMNCIGLTSIVVEDGNPNYDSRNNCNAVIETATNTLLRGCRNTVIPDDIEAFGSFSMSNLFMITLTTLPSTVKYIGEFAFLNCVNITSLTIPGRVKTIDEMAFDGCTGMTELILEKGVETLVGGAFQSCLGLTELTLPATIQSLGNNLIINSINIKTIRVLFSEPIPINGSTFDTYYSPSTMTLYVPKGCRDAFAAADYWKDFGKIIEMDEEPEWIDYFFYDINGTKMYFRILDRENKTVEIGLGDEPAIDTTLSGELALPSEVKGYTVVGIATNAFAGCAGITEVTIPATIMSIVGGAFSGNTAMVKVTYEGSPCPIATDAFDAYTYNNAKLIVDDDKKTEFAKTQGWEKFISLVADLFIGDTFTDTTVEGIVVTYTVTSLTPKTAKVGIDAYTPGIPSGSSGTITIPASAKGYQVTAIASGAFARRSKVTEVNLPSTIVTLEDYAFGNTSLKYVTLPASVQSIGTDVFSLSNNMTSVRVLSTTPIAIKEDVFPKRANLFLFVPYSGKEAYQGAAYWKDFKAIVELPEDASDILLPGSTFTSQTVEGIEVTYTVTSLSPKTVKVASNSISNKTEGILTIPGNVEGYEVTGVAKEAFSYASMLTEIKLPATITSLDEKTFLECYAKEINIPENVTAIPNYAFGYSDINRITIPASVQSIGSNAFYKCDELAFVFMESATPITIPEDAFPTRANVTLYVQKGSKSAYEAANYWKEFKEIIELPEDMTGILLPGSSFTSPTVEGIEVTYTVTSLSPKTVKVASNSISNKTEGILTIPGNVEGYEVTGVAKKAFRSAFYLTEIKLPATITTLDEEAFYFCYAKEINIPENVTAIPKDAFYFSDIKRITIPASVQSIGSNAFYKCDKLAFVFMESATPITIPEDAFPTRANVTLYVPKGNKSAYEAADYWKEFKEIIELPEDMTGILLPGSSFTSPTVEGVEVTYTVMSLSPKTVKVASNSISNKTEGILTIPANVEGYEVTGIAKEAFRSAFYLTEIKLPATITTLDEEAFYFCYAKEINIPENVIAIPKDAFYYSDINHITIPASVQSIGSNAFYKCDELAFVFMESATPITIPEDAFPTRANVTLCVPKESKSAYEAADYWKEFKEIIVTGDGADNIYCENQTVYTGSTVEIAVNLTNTNTYTAYQFDLELPKGITIATDENNEYMVTMSDRYINGEYQVVLNKLTNNTYRIFCSSQNGQVTIKGSEGTILTITLNVSQTMATGQYKAKIKNVILTLTDASKLKATDTLFTIDTEKIIMGDTNNDGTIDVADIVAMINAILGTPSSDYHAEVADINGDQEVDVFDVMKAINLLFNQNNAPRRLARTTRNAEEQIYVTMTANDVKFGINDADRFTAFQFDVAVADGMELTNACLTMNETNHFLQFIKNGQNTYKVVGLSLNNSTLSANENDLVELSFSKGGNVQIDNIIFVTPEETKVYFTNREAVVTDIVNMVVEQQAEEVYDLSGRKVSTDSNLLPKGVYIINNKKVIVK